MISTITVAGQTVTLIDLPTKPGFRTVELKGTDTVAKVSSPFTGQTQAQKWPGADSWQANFTLPPMRPDSADPWICALLACRGIANAFLLGDPDKKAPTGNLLGSLPKVDGTSSDFNKAGAEVLHLKGFKASTAGVLLPGNHLQIGYRLHRVLERVNSDSAGKASFQIYPTLREQPADNASVIFNNPRGLFRRADNTQPWSYDYKRLVAVSINAVEYR